uniref:Uncharacterized protein n=1 Tax=Trichogramma kaykai TaxID=54128 RepID=A0ABD2XG62_9HYME
MLSAIYHKVSRIEYEGSEFSSLNNYVIIINFLLKIFYFFRYLYIRHFSFVNVCTVRFVFFILLRIISYILSTRVCFDIFRNKFFL